MPSDKTVVVAELYRRYKAGDFPDGIVSSEHLVEAIDAVGSTLSKRNTANFLKDLLRSPALRENWPAEAIAERVFARQRYGERRVMQFYHYPEGSDPFAPEFEPNNLTPIHSLQTASIPYLARSLGRSEETWLMQMAVQLRLVETQLALSSPTRLAARLRDVVHLQTGIKTQPEIDGAWLATYGMFEGDEVMNVLVTCEVKRHRERILVNQIREQVAKSFEITANLTHARIDAVKPLAITIVRHPYEGRTEPMIFVIEFEHIGRSEYEAMDLGNNFEALFELDLRPVSNALYRPVPAIPALGRPTGD